MDFYDKAVSAHHLACMLGYKEGVFYMGETAYHWFLSNVLIQTHPRKVFQNTLLGFKVLPDPTGPKTDRFFLLCQDGSRKFYVDLA